MLQTNQEQHIQNLIAAQPDTRRADIQALHNLTLSISSGCKLWFDDGLNEENKVVTNPTIGYGSFMLKYADGKTREWFRIGISPNKTGITVYIMGLKDKNHLPDAYGKRIGKASVTTYCIKFKTLKDIDLNILEEAIRFGFNSEK